jgi:hypothetical protein
MSKIKFIKRQTYENHTAKSKYFCPNICDNHSNFNHAPICIALIYMEIKLITEYYLVFVVLILYSHSCITVYLNRLIFFLEFLPKKIMKLVAINIIIFYFKVQIIF